MKAPRKTISIAAPVAVSAPVVAAPVVAAPVAVSAPVVIDAPELIAAISDFATFAAKSDQDKGCKIATLAPLMVAAYAGKDSDGCKAVRKHLLPYYIAARLTFVRKLETALTYDDIAKEQGATATVNMPKDFQDAKKFGSTMFTLAQDAAGIDKDGLPKKVSAPKIANAGTGNAINAGQGSEPVAPSIDYVQVVKEAPEGDLVVVLGAMPSSAWIALVVKVARIQFMKGGSIASEHFNEAIVKASVELQRENAIPATPCAPPTN